MTVHLLMIGMAEVQSWTVTKDRRLPFPGFSVATRTHCEFSAQTFEL